MSARDCVQAQLSLLRETLTFSCKPRGGKEVLGLGGGGGEEEGWGWWCWACAEGMKEGAYLGRILIISWGV